MTKDKIKLLIIDDEKDVCEFEKSYFEKRGFEVLTARTGKSGVTLAKMEKPDVAIIDIHMAKGMDGIEVLRNILALNPKCKCVMVSWDKERAGEAKKSGAAGFVIKPNNIEDLEMVVKKAAKEERTDGQSLTGRKRAL